MGVTPASRNVSLMPPERLRRGSDIRAVFAARRRGRGTYVDVHLRDRRSGQLPRVAVVAGKRVGPAVRRNRAKRRLRALAREVGMPRGRDAVLVARAGADQASFETLRREIAQVGNPGHPREGGRRG